ncbi:sheath polysaccharide-degrading enzyme [Streptomyces sp. WAC05374]|uniref:right-handed parallel beta-helix repeat-containing protein n=1 Tax=Streptomyces sp. WAC05374 TaxID=2487420 RepID=UPI001056972D|nr:right-handed parallel beta-helix repeat-containing protein [Streptomyces sp. WAC05374]TDF48406.1 sheath polysaccharide-degrading enzyme [Streptomyces sp. WAC05374]TDF55038.1 sheath polysaccharide-degrading enzyme [Streptomyces sp. WAC05374]TDF55340.1 sheath polysaccharide-degrading enzyme [Streptomyces sp. WAC05374]
MRTRTPAPRDPASRSRTAPRALPARPAPLAGLLAAALATGLTLLGPATAGASPVAVGATPAAVVDVATAAQLKSALADARPGDTIRLADGTYTGNFKATTPAASSARITLTGSSRAVLTAGGGYGLHLDGASHWTVKGITVTGGQKGIMIDTATGVVIDSVTVHGLDMEGVHFRKSSTNGVIKNSRVHDTGNDGRGMGEGIYVGTANTVSDRSDHVQILNNVIGPDVGGESVDIKEGTTGARIIGNTFLGRGMTGVHHDDSWVDVKGNDVLVENNTGRDTLNNGFEVHTQLSGWGCGTVFRANRSDLTGATGPNRYAIHAPHHSSSCRTTVYADNTRTGGRALVTPGVPVTG